MSSQKLLSSEHSDSSHITLFIRAVCLFKEHSAFHTSHHDTLLEVLLHKRIHTEQRQC